MSNLLLALHAIANGIITLAAGYLMWHAWKTDREAVRRFREIMDGTVKSRMEDAFKRVFSQDPSDEVEKSWTSELIDRREYSNYLNGLKGEFPLSFPEWKESRKEVANG